MSIPVRRIGNRIVGLGYEIPALNAHLATVIATSRQPCDCIDCDGKWCVWCLEHHGLKPCLFVEAIS